MVNARLKLVAMVLQVTAKHLVVHVFKDPVALENYAAIQEHVRLLDPTVEINMVTLKIVLF